MAASLKFFRGNVAEKPIKDGQFLIDAGTKQIYTDIGTNRLHLGGLIEVNSNADLPTNVGSIVPDALYYVKNTNVLAKFDGSNWIQLNAITESNGISEVVTQGTGNAVTAITYDQVSKKLTYTLGETFVTQAEFVIPEYSVAKDTSNSEATVYHLTKDGVNVGEPISIPGGMVIKSATVETVTTPNTPYEGAVAGDVYIDFIINSSPEKHIYVPAKDLFVPYTAGKGIALNDHVFSLDIDETGPLSFAGNKLTIAKATTEVDGYMAKEDKASVDTIPTLTTAVESLTSALVWEES